MSDDGTNPGVRLRRLAAAELAEIGRELVRAGQGKDNGVYRARKALQRLRSILRLASAADPGWVARCDRQLRTLRRRMGRLRDAAVRVELVEKRLAAADPSDAALLREGLVVLRERRARAWAETPADFWGQLDRAFQRQLRLFEAWPLDDIRPAQIEHALERARRRLREELRAALGASQRNARHDLRRHLRRYAAMRKAAAQALRRRDPAAARLVDAARALGEEGDLWLTCTALRESLPGVAGRGLRSTLEKQRRALCRLHDGELVAIRRQLLAKRPRPRKPSHPVASGDLRDDLP